MCIHGNTHAQETPINLDITKSTELPCHDKGRHLGVWASKGQQTSAARLGNPLIKVLMQSCQLLSLRGRVHSSLDTTRCQC